MHSQALSYPNCDFSPMSYSPISSYAHCIRFANLRLTNGFCNVGKSLSQSPSVWRTHGDTVRIRCEGLAGKDDGFYIRRCIEIAKKAIGCTSPNPMVGCVIVKDGTVVGEGFHPKAGQPHAEVFALRDAGDLAENATAYVSLEPCNHYGRTPPCTEALIKAKVKRVVVGMVDPNPIVASKGVDRLRESGIDVTVGVEEEMCKRLNEAYIHHMLTRNPFLTMRYSLSTNGQILNHLGEGAKESGGYYSQLVQEYDGIILSSASLNGKSYFPSSQEPQAKQPLQIILAKALNSPLQLPFLTAEAASQAIIFTEMNTVVDTDVSRQGIETVVLDKLDLSTILDYCGRRGLCSVLLDLQGSVENFEDILEDSLERGLLQKVVMEVLPFWVGSEDSSILPLKMLQKVIPLKKLRSRILKETVLVEGYF
ncbi:hypothetical protein GIB67_036377 [Kingdonia uniflora]|uniref:Riboflavin biosynthesis protein PYRD, chloroplastic n=1 Tax=Kingdonia uniflora TaxID=39325 RepID=A0A7J7L3Z6_9MAGN|nr:hypothetical protein GIB67_036377 [Kingdonia uniflora]